MKENRKIVYHGAASERGGAGVKLAFILVALFLIAHAGYNFIPVAYELTILCASFGAFLGMLAMNGLPRPHHPIFNAPRFELATQDKFFLCIEANDPMFDIERTEQFLESLGPDAVSIVEK